MHLHANYVSTSVFGDGDYYQAMFQTEQDADDPNLSYPLIFSRAKMQLEVGPSLRRLSYDES